MTAPAKVAMSEAMPEDKQDAETVLAQFDGDAMAALKAAIEDIAHLRRELALASLAMSYGFARGWRPQIVKPEGD
jgi:hypothetical protein